MSLPSPMPICLVCGRLSCPLTSHYKYIQYLREVQAKAEAERKRNERRLTPAQGQALALVTGDSLLDALSPRLARQIENPRIDPFARYPLEMTEEMHYLLDLWSQPWGRTSKAPQRHLFPRPVIDMVLPHCMSNALFLEATISVSAAQNALGHLGRLDEVAIRHQRRTIELHRKECAGDQKAASSDTNILAAMSILSIYLEQGMFKEAESLMAGINALVRLRGGPYYLGIDGLVTDCLMMSDFSCSVYSYSAPLYKMTLPAILSEANAYESWMGTGFKDMLSEGAIDADLGNAAADLVRYVELFELGARRKIAPRHLNIYGYIAAVVDYQIAQLNAKLHDSGGMDELICLAFILINLVVMRNLGSVNHGTKRLEAQFWKTLLTAGQRGDWESVDARLLIWVSMTGLIVSIREASPWKPTCLRVLKSARERLELTDWEDVRRKVLDRFVWSELAQDEACYALWQASEQYQEPSTAVLANIPTKRQR